MDGKRTWSAGLVVVLGLAIGASGSLLVCLRMNSHIPNSDDNRGGAAGGEAAFAERRRAMVESQIAARGVKDRRVLEALRRVPRRRFVPVDQRGNAYLDRPLPIAEDQTISQPYIVAYMTELLRLTPESKVLEIGTGSGYQAAVLGELCAEVYSIEIVRGLGERAEQLLKELGYTNIQVKIGDGYRGWPEEAPFDAIIVTAAPGHVPQPLLDQLAEGGRMVIPVGESYQELKVFTREKDRIKEKVDIPVLFVPMTGEAERR